MAYYMYIEKVLFPITPGKISIKVNGNNKTLTLINEGVVNLIKSPGLTDIEIPELILPAMQKYPFANHENEKGSKAAFHNAKYYLDKLETWKKKKKPVKWKLIRISPNGKTLLWDSSMDVTIEDYTATEDADDQGFDVSVSLNMKQYRYFGAKKLTVKKTKKATKKTTVKKKATRAKKKETAKTYEVREGDCLYNIAKKQLGNASKWKSIYTLNKKTIEAAAKKHGRKSSSNGRWIYPGTKLKLPK